MKSLNIFYNVKISNNLFSNETDGIPHLHIKVALYYIYDVLFVSIILSVCFLYIHKTL